MEKRRILCRFIKDEDKVKSKVASVTVSVICYRHLQIFIRQKAASNRTYNRRSGLLAAIPKCWITNLPTQEVTASMQYPIYSPPNQPNNYESTQPNFDSFLRQTDESLHHRGACARASNV